MSQYGIYIPIKIRCKDYKVDYFVAYTDSGSGTYYVNLYVFHHNIMKPYLIEHRVIFLIALLL